MDILEETNMKLIKQEVLNALDEAREPEPKLDFRVAMLGEGDQSIDASPEDLEALVGTGEIEPAAIRAYLGRYHSRLKEEECKTYTREEA